MSKTINITNRKARFEYQFLQEYEAGIVLEGTEVKSIRAGNANINDAYCIFTKEGELIIKSLYIAEYKMGNINNHESRRDRKLLMKKLELKKLLRRVKEKGFSIVPFKISMNERGFVKIQVALATGKKSYDKRNNIKDRQNKRDLDRVKKAYN